ncbi:LptF/LptG family permease [Luteolibacter sp. AS25]|uniref:LptF/LptG family permease n=1 Tax=Luteolibacter sp. AS25 TaxID=3135776 RepID=UPI00398AB363
MQNLQRWLLPLALFIVGAIAAALLVPLEATSVNEQITGFPDSDRLTHSLRPWILGFLCFMPAIAAIAYTFGTTFDRYLSRQFISIFSICLCSLFGIWLLLDLNDNLGDFKGSQNMLKSVLLFYVFRAPAILLLIFPYTLLLALIYGLGKLSKTNEIIAIIQSGTGIVRVSFPLIFAGLWCSVLLIGLNYHWAPHAEGRRDELIAVAKGMPVLEASNVLYRDPGSGRLWMVGAFPANYQKGEPLQNIEVTTMRKDQTISSRITSDSAKYQRATREWTLENPVIARFAKGESPKFEKMDEPLVKTTWSETPSQIIKPGLAIEYLGIPELTSWLKSPIAGQATANVAGYLTHWHYRWALPITCLVTVLLAAPLSIHFARRGAGSGIFVAVVLSAMMLFFSSICLALGEASIVAPALAAWLPNIIFTLIGLWLYHRRVTGRPIYQTVRRILTISN